MIKQKKIGFMGSGNISRAMISGLVREGQISKDRILVSGRNKEQLAKLEKNFGVKITKANAQVVRDCDIIILAVKPQALPRALKEIPLKGISKKLFVSVAAGVSKNTLESLMPKGSRIVLAMPNITCSVGEGVTAIAEDETCKEEDRNLTEELFQVLGKTVFVEEEQLDAVTGLSGSGPSYIFLIIDALADAGVKVGLSRDRALKLAAQTVLGASKLLIESGEHPGRLKDRVTSPGGTAIAGIHTLEEGGLRTTLINAVEKATQRASELGKKYNGGK